jgi:ABC-type phosphonate transport system ATPase subunit
VANGVSVEEVCERFRALAPGAIAGVEGFCGSGKSTLAGQLGERVAMNVFHLDSFARKFDRPPAYTSCLDLERLRHALEG